MNYLDRYAFWCASNLPEDARAELEEIAENDEELRSRFGSDLQFGTAGMRGVMGMGTNRLNRYTVRRAAQGMAQWLSETKLPQIAAIGYDSRHNSKLFAQICAVAFAEKNIKTYLFDRLAPTPMLSYAVRQLGCGCGIVISASHNSGEYNGVKCYGPDGCQMTDEPAAIVTEKINAIPYFIPEEKTFEEFKRLGLIEHISQTLWERYYDTVIREAVNPSIISKSGLNIVYTPLCGTGNEPVREVLGRLGVNVTVVSCQEHPDGDFKTCEYPNPETDAALNESYRVANQVSCDVILGTDPDCDRVAIAIPEGNGFRKLSGNELGCLLLDYILKTRSANGDIPENAIAVRSIVSSPLSDKIADKYTNSKSKWSRKTVIDDINGGFKDWNCDIRVSHKTSPSMILHEHIHAHSASYQKPSIYSANANIEEATVQLLTQEICKKERIAITASIYDDLVDTLKVLNTELRIKETQMDFAKELISKPIEKRTDFLLEKLAENEELGFDKKWELQNMIETLKGSDIFDD